MAGYGDADAFVATLGAYRRQAGLTRGDLAEATGFDASYITRLLNGSRHPTPETIRRLAQALNVGPWVEDDLLIRAGYLPSPPGVLALAARLMYLHPTLDPLASPGPLQRDCVDAARPPG
jgi:transcriptional regulator with XRE-family HTH domain